MTSRLFLESPCEHGEIGEHLLRWRAVFAGKRAIPFGQMCPGGSRTEITPDYSKGLNVLIDKWWDEGAADLDVFTEAVDTALGLTEGDTDPLP